MKTKLAKRPASSPMPRLNLLSSRLGNLKKPRFQRSPAISREVARHSPRGAKVNLAGANWNCFGQARQSPVSTFYRFSQHHRKSRTGAPSQNRKHPLCIRVQAHGQTSKNLGHKHPFRARLSLLSTKYRFSKALAPLGFCPLEIPWSLPFGHCSFLRGHFRSKCEISFVTPVNIASYPFVPPSTTLRRGENPRRSASNPCKNQAPRLLSHLDFTCRASPGGI